jgi:hypothetical protein
MPEAPFAYSMVHVESGWSWSVLDEDGETVASGQDLSQSRAQAAVEAEIRRVSELLA